MAPLDDRYRQMFTTSAQAYEEAKGLFPGGITHQNRYASPFPVYFTHAAGGLKWDLDGHEIIDYVMAMARSCWAMRIPRSWQLSRRKWPREPTSAATPNSKWSGPGRSNA